MPGNTFGQSFRITTCGESHGGAVGVIIDGCPAGLTISLNEIQAECDRRRPGQSHLTTPRQEQDQIHIMSGIFEGKTTGAPILLMAYNKDQRPEDYAHLKDVYRPSHADFTFDQKFGHRDYRGGGRASARETLARVAAGAVAKKLLASLFGIEILSYVSHVGPIKADIASDAITPAKIEATPIRCPHHEAAEEMIAFIEQTKAAGDSLGGIITGLIRHCPVGLGEPVFDKLPADLAKAMMSINATKGFDIGSGFDGVGMLGSEHNDAFVRSSDGIHTSSNHAGGTLGGISSGEDIIFRVAFKPVSTLAQEQHTITNTGEAITYEAKGRHDPCVLPRAVPIVDAMAALVLADHLLRHQSTKCQFFHHK